MGRRLRMLASLSVLYNYLSILSPLLLSSVSTYPSQFRPYFTGYLESQKYLLSIQSFLLDNVPSLMGETEPGALRLILLHQGVAQPLQLPKR